jgi:hypothetical protein
MGLDISLYKCQYFELRKLVFGVSGTSKNTMLPLRKSRLEPVLFRIPMRSENHVVLGGDEDGDGDGYRILLRVSVYYHVRKLG